jgi:hypothetical protein
MKVGGHYGLQDVSRRDWEKCAAQLRLAADAVLQRINLAEEAGLAMTKAGLTSPLIGQWVARLAGRVRACLIKLGR